MVAPTTPTPTPTPAPAPVASASVPMPGAARTCPCPNAPAPHPCLLLSALANNEPLPAIITRLHLSAENLHTFLSTPGIPDQLQALRALTHFAEDLQQSAARTEATAFLRTFLTENHKPDEKRRAATALLRGPARPSAPTSMNPDRKGGAHPRAKPDIADWSPSDPTPDDQDDADLDEETGDGPSPSPPHRLTVSPSHEKPRPDWYRPPPPPSPPLSATPEEVVNHQIDQLRKLETPDPADATRAIYESLSMPIKMFADCKQAFKDTLADSGALELANTADSPDLQITTTPATIDSAADPPLATVHVTITHAGARTTAIRFHLFHENYHNLPNNLRWLTAIIIRDDTS